jgi:hypothetical protein
MRGRKPAGAVYVQQLDGSAQAKERLQAILETLTGSTRVHEACEQLGICPQRFHQLRQQALAAALAGLEARPVGRPRQQAEVSAAQCEALAQQLEATQVELRAAQVREELALILPGRGGATAAADEPGAGKKTTPPGRPGRSSRGGSSNRTRRSR